jgi:hypothetical protein
MQHLDAKAVTSCCDLAMKISRRPFWTRSARQTIRLFRLKLRFGLPDLLNQIVC